VGDFNTSVLGLDCAPTGNPPDTKTTFSIQGRTSAADQREFLVNLGLVSSTVRWVMPSPEPCHRVLGVVSETHARTH
jgi:hypothetical protein